MRAGEVSDALASQVDSVAAYLLPNGKREGREWCVGSVAGEGGKSLKLSLSGARAGRWKDFATDQGGDLIDLWAATRGVDLRTAINEAKEYLGIREERIENKRRVYSRPSREGVSRLPPQIAEWLRVVRKITEPTVEAFKLAARNGALMFPYLRDGELVAAKYRKVPAKEFFVDADCEPCLFGWQALPGSVRSVVICEGELDALAFREYGVHALSVPFGGGKGAKQAQWIEAEFDRLAMFDTLYLALDNDGPGRDATEEIVARLGRERCRIVKLPRKDANECLIDGVPKADVHQAIADAVTLDPDELRSAADYEDELVLEFEGACEPEPGIRLPWEKVHDQLVLRMGEVSIWAGYSGHGKSEIAGHLTAGAIKADWRACVASMEFRPRKWLKRLVRQATAQSAPSLPYVRYVANWFRERLWVFDRTGNAKAQKVLEVFEYAARRYGVKLFVIDNLSKCGFAEDDYNGQKAFVDQLTDLAKRMDAHIALVHHLRKTESEDKPGGKMDVLGGGGITNMADTIVNVWRNKPKEKAMRKLKLAEPQTEEARKKLDAEEQELRAKPDCILNCHKQRNGEHEPVILLWFDRGSHQFLQNDSAKARPLVGFSIVENGAAAEPQPVEDLL